MNLTYTGDVSLMSQQQLLEALADLAAIWTKNPSLSSDYNEGYRCTELEEALKNRFSMPKRITLVTKPNLVYVVH